MNNKWESMSSAKERIKSSGPRKPLRTISEMADEFGVTKMSLVNFMRNSETSPKPKPVSKNSVSVWYDPDEVRQWWAGI
jgi:hypothetical protein